MSGSVWQPSEIKHRWKKCSESDFSLSQLKSSCEITGLVNWLSLWITSEKKERKNEQEVWRIIGRTPFHENDANILTRFLFGKKILVFNAGGTFLR